MLRQIPLENGAAPPSRIVRRGSGSTIANFVEGTAVVDGGDHPRGPHHPHHHHHNINNSNSLAGIVGDDDDSTQYSAPIDGSRVRFSDDPPDHEDVPLFNDGIPYAATVGSSNGQRRPHRQAMHAANYFPSNNHSRYPSKYVCDPVYGFRASCDPRDLQLDMPSAAKCHGMTPPDADCVNNLLRDTVPTLQKWYRDITTNSNGSAFSLSKILLLVVVVFCIVHFMLTSTVPRHDPHGALLLTPASMEAYGSGSYVQAAYPAAASSTSWGGHAQQPHYMHDPMTGAVATPQAGASPLMVTHMQQPHQQGGPMMMPQQPMMMQQQQPGYPPMMMQQQQPMMANQGGGMFLAGMTAQTGGGVQPAPQQGASSSFLGGLLRGGGSSSNVASSTGDGDGDDGTSSDAMSVIATSDAGMSRPIPAVSDNAFDSLSHFKDAWDEHEKSDIPVFWHIPKSGGSTIKDVIGSCHRFVMATEFGITDGHENDKKIEVVYPTINMPGEDRSPFVNVDTTTVEGINRAAAMGFADTGLAETVVTPFLYEANDLFTATSKGRLFAIFRHPIDRAISMFYYIQVATWEPTYDPELKGWTLEQYAQSPRIENNWMTRMLSNQPEGDIDISHVELAMEVIRRKFVVGLMTRMEESMTRLEQFFGWTYHVNPINQEACRTRLLSGGSNSNSKNKKEKPQEGDVIWSLIAAQNQMDLQLYGYIESLFEEQAQFVDGVDPKIRDIGSTCCKCEPPTFPVEGFTCPKKVLD